jgi:hypothetical protein
LQKLVSHGIFEAVPAPCGTAYQEYALTEKGRRLYLVLVAMRQWGENFLFKEGELDLLLADRESRQPVKPVGIAVQAIEVGGLSQGPIAYGLERLGIEVSWEL